MDAEAGLKRGKPRKGAGMIHQEGTPGRNRYAGQWQVRGPKSLTGSIVWTSDGYRILRAATTTRILQCPPAYPPTRLPGFPFTPPHTPRLSPHPLTCAHHLPTLTASTILHTPTLTAYPPTTH